jgi:Fe-S cluster assembly scaffold protein SufB
MKKTAPKNFQQTVTVDSVENSQHVISQPGKYEYIITKPGVELEVSGTFHAQKKDNIEVSVIIHHQAPHTRANTVLKGVATDEARIKFVGRIIIDEDCGDSNSFLTERILLLSDQAKAEAIPDLEILTDDVKCSHAASISRVPEEHLFYLMSRGISRSKAEAMIVEGFLR